MKEGHLPVRYLGVPLISSRLSSADCGTLLDRITGRIDLVIQESLLCMQVSVVIFCPLQFASLLDRDFHSP
jgi:hypothetical protein